MAMPLPSASPYYPRTYPQAFMPDPAAGSPAARFSGETTPPTRSSQAGSPRFGCLGTGIGEAILGCCGCCLLPLVAVGTWIALTLSKIAKRV